jgi:hypothetical protein
LPSESDRVSFQEILEIAHGYFLIADFGHDVGVTASAAQRQSGGESRQDEQNC